MSQNEIKARHNSLSNRIVRIDTTLSGHVKLFEKHEHYDNERFKSVHSHMDKLELRLARIEKLSNKNYNGITTVVAMIRTGVKLLIGAWVVVTVLAGLAIKFI